MLTYFLADEGLGGRVMARVKAIRYLGTLGLDCLLEEESIALELIEGEEDDFSRMAVPDIENPEINYTLSSAEYLVMVRRRIGEVVIP